MERGLEREFSWSCSRHRLFVRCERAYYHKHYGSWEGWLPHADHISRRSYVLKHLQDRGGWAAEAFAATVKSQLRRAATLGSAPSPADFAWDAYQRLTRQATETLHGDWRADPKRFCLQESYYGYGDSPSDVAAGVMALVQESLETFCASPLAADLLAVPFFAFDDSPGPKYFLLDGLKVWIAPQLSWTVKGQEHLLRFHLHAPGTDNWPLPMGVNALGAELAKRKHPDDVVCHSVFIASGGVQDLPDRLEAEATAELIRESSRTMRSRLTADGKPHPENFPAAPDASACPACQYRELCQR